MRLSRWSCSPRAWVPLMRWRPRPVRVVLVGAARAESVRAGLDVVAAAAQGFADVNVLVHDAARPCLNWADLERLRDEAGDEHGGLLAVPVIDTLKRAKQGVRVEATVDRSLYWRAQTPQLFRLDLLIAALRDASTRGIEITDEASAMEFAGYHPRLVRGRESNLKVTYAEDLALAIVPGQGQRLGRGEHLRIRRPDGRGVRQRSDADPRGHHPRWRGRTDRQWLDPAGERQDRGSRRS